SAYQRKLCPFDLSLVYMDEAVVLKRENNDIIQTERQFAIANVIAQALRSGNLGRAYLWLQQSAKCLAGLAPSHQQRGNDNQAGNSYAKFHLRPPREMNLRAVLLFVTNSFDRIEPRGFHCGINTKHEPHRDRNQKC